MSIADNIYNDDFGLDECSSHSSSWCGDIDSERSAIVDFRHWRAYDFTDSYGHVPVLHDPCSEQHEYMELARWLSAGGGRDQRDLYACNSAVAAARICPRRKSAGGAWHKPSESKRNSVASTDRRPRWR